MRPESYRRHAVHPSHVSPAHVDQEPDGEGSQGRGKNVDRSVSPAYRQDKRQEPTARESRKPITAHGGMSSGATIASRPHW